MLVCFIFSLFVISLRFIALFHAMLSSLFTRVFRWFIIHYVMPADAFSAPAHGFASPLYYIIIAHALANLLFFFCLIFITVTSHFSLFRFAVCFADFCLFSLRVLVVLLLVSSGCLLCLA